LAAVVREATENLKPRSARYGIPPTAPGKVTSVTTDHRPPGRIRLRRQAEESKMAGKTLYERLGGAYAIATAVDHLVDRLHTNATLNSRNQKVKEFHTAQYKAGYKFMVSAWCIEVTGGPKCYPGRDMFESHKHLGLTDYEFDVTAHEIQNTLYQLGVPPQEIGEFLDIIESYRGKVLSRA
jgi:hemoglobin